MNTTLTVQVAPDARVVVQVPPAAPVGLENGCGVPPPKVNDPPASATFPVLVTVKVIGPLVVPVAQLPKASGVGETVAVLTAAVPVPVIETGAPFTLALFEVTLSEAE